ncbi:6033_t:CDS:2 [Racocetra fulgida]|uniref:6033_t:CDS:1 n=1 Tax=Racocetra fulgida TaxID=60492 RepID=A0A9N8ZKZ5_9GLOM|nr:6033_t:CDS:2 [Racocetra fulgida]
MKILSDFWHLSSSASENLERTQTDFNVNKKSKNLDSGSEVMAKIFKEAEAQNDAIKFVYEIEIDQDILDAVSLTKHELNNNDLKTIENKFHQLAHAFIMPLESGSGYYWEDRKNQSSNYLKE